MRAKTVLLPARPFIGAAAVACTLFAGSVAAGEKPIEVSVHVTTQGLDLNKPADARAFYARLRNGARVVCTHGNRVSLAPLPDPQSCSEQALADAIRSTKAPLLTQIYLTTHTLQDAAARGIDLPAQLAAFLPQSMPR